MIWNYLLEHSYCEQIYKYIALNSEIDGCYLEDVRV